MAEKLRQVIIGNSGAALSAIKAIRKADAHCPITVVTEGKVRAYSPVLTTYYIAGRTPKGKLYVTDTAFYRRQGVNIISETRALSVDTNSRKVVLENKSSIEYDNLLIATGASAKKLEIPGGDLPVVRTLRSLEDADAIKRMMKRGAKAIVVLGAGLVSLQVADAIFHEGVRLTFLVGSDQVLSQNVDKTCAGIIKTALDPSRVTIHFGTDAEAIEKVKRKAVVISKTGERFLADMVIVGKGVTPNTQLVQGSAIAVNKGILVDEYMKTNIPNVYAAGDVAEGPGFFTGRREVVATWFNACQQGWIAGTNMAGKKETFSGGLNRNITTVFGITVASIGSVKGSEGDGVEEIVINRPGEGIYRKLLLQGNVIRGALLMGRISDAGIAQSLIQKRVTLPPREEIPEKAFLNLRQLSCTVLNPTA